jgi:GT2 family glycosyltransferase
VITSSVVLYHTDKKQLDTIIDCVLNSFIDYLFLIDNSSNDSLRIIEKASEKIRYIHSKNLGYGGGHNIAIRESIMMNAKYHVVINPDIYFDDDVITVLSKYMDQNPDCGLVMPKVFSPNGELQYICKLLPTPLDLFGRRFLPFKNFIKERNRKYELHFTNYDTIMEVPYLSGCFMFFRNSVLKKVGLFDEQYFMYAEDLDICRRINKVAQTIYYPLVFVHHEYEKGSYKDNKLLKYHVISVIKYFSKWGWFFDKERHAVNKRILKELGYKNK